MSEFLQSLKELSNEACFERTADATYSYLCNTSAVNNKYRSSGNCSSNEGREEEKEEDWRKLFTDPLNANIIKEDHRSISRRCSVLTTLLHADCDFDCAYCRVCKRSNPASVTPKELADYFITMNRKGVYEGLFLSSGISGDVDTIMAEIIETGERIRNYGFNGYLHLKILPGATRSDIDAAARIASRVSINIETTSASHMSEIASVKDYKNDILKRLDWLGYDAPKKHTTQFIVGAADESDREIISNIGDLYRNVKPARIYFSAFIPQKKTPLEKHTETPQWRANRLYQTDFLIRDYSYKPDEFYQVLNDENNLINEDPKILLAKDLPRINPTSANIEELMKVPGIGPVGAKKIYQLQRKLLRFQRELSKKNCIKDSESITADCKKYEEEIYKNIPKRALTYIQLQNKTRQATLSDLAQS